MRSLPVFNAVGDLVLTDHPDAMRVLAAPLSLSRSTTSSVAVDPRPSMNWRAGFKRTRTQPRNGFGSSMRSGSSRAANLSRTMSRLVGKARGKGVFFEIPDDPDGAAAARLLSKAMILRYVDRPIRWVAEQEPQLSLDWARAAGLFNAGVTLTPGELRDIQDGLERLLEPFLNRDAVDVPADARRVRILSYFMPSLS